MNSVGFNYTLVGLGLSFSGAVLGLTHGRRRTSYFANEIYHMTARSHQRFGALSIVFGIGFVLALYWPILNTPLLAIYVLSLVLYLSSFARGFSDEDQ